MAGSRREVAIGRRLRAHADDFSPGAWRTPLSVVFCRAEGCEYMYICTYTYTCIMCVCVGCCPPHAFVLRHARNRISSVTTPMNRWVALAAQQSARESACRGAFSVLIESARAADSRQPASLSACPPHHKEGLQRSDDGRGMNMWRSPTQERPHPIASHGPTKTSGRLA